MTVRDTTAPTVTVPERGDRRGHIVAWGGGVVHGHLERRRVGQRDGRVRAGIGIDVPGRFDLSHVLGDATRPGTPGTATFTVTVRDTTAPIVTETATPTKLLWSPNKTMTPVVVSGRVSDVSRIATMTYRVLDEYGYNQPSGSIVPAADGSYSFTVLLEAWRKGTDKSAAGIHDQSDCHGRVREQGVGVTTSGSRTARGSRLRRRPASVRHGGAVGAYRIRFRASATSGSAGAASRAFRKVP